LAALSGNHLPRPGSTPPSSSSAFQRGPSPRSAAMPKSAATPPPPPVGRPSTQVSGETFPGVFRSHPAPPRPKRESSRPWRISL